MQSGLFENYVYTHFGFKDGKPRKYSLRSVQQFITKYQNEIQHIEDDDRLDLVAIFLEYWQNAKQELQLKKQIGNRTDKTPTNEDIIAIQHIRKLQLQLNQQIEEIKKEQKKNKEIALSLNR